MTMMVEPKNRETVALHRLVPSVPPIERLLEMFADGHRPFSVGDGNRVQR